MPINRRAPALRYRVIASLCALALVSGGCSFAFVSGPPRHHEKLPIFDCTSSNLVPILDTIFTTLQAIRVGYALSRSDEDYEMTDQPLSRNADLTLGLIFGALGAAGMYYGYTNTSRCRVAKDELLQRMMREPTAPATWPPPAGTPPGETRPAITPAAPEQPAPEEPAPDIQR